MSNLFYVTGTHELHPGPVQAYSQLMAPNHGNIPIVGRVAALGNGEGLEIAVRFAIDQDMYLSPFHHRIYTSQELADCWERSHHEHHGYDPRGLDPRVEPTRLTVPRDVMMREALYR